MPKKIDTEFQNQEYKRVYAKIEPHKSDYWCGFSIPPGWIYLVEELHDTLVSIDPNYKLTQAKEKFGGLRYYLDNPDGNFNPELEAIISTYEKISQKVCENCGDGASFGEINNSFVTLCEECRFDTVQRYEIARQAFLDSK